MPIRHLLYGRNLLGKDHTPSPPVDPTPSTRQPCLYHPLAYPDRNMGAKKSKTEPPPSQAPVEETTSTGLHLIELHSPSVGVSFLTMAIVALAFYAIYRCTGRFHQRWTRRTTSRLPVVDPENLSWPQNKIYGHGSRHLDIDPYGLMNVQRMPRIVYNGPRVQCTPDARFSEIDDIGQVRTTDRRQARNAETPTPTDEVTQKDTHWTRD